MTEIVRGLDKEGMQGIMSSVSEWKSLDQGVATQMVAGFDPALDSELIIWGFIMEIDC